MGTTISLYFSQSSQEPNTTQRKTQNPHMGTLKQRQQHHLPQEFLGIFFSHGRVQTGYGRALLLCQRERGDVGDKDFVLGVQVPQHLLSKLTLNLSRKWISGAEISEQVTAHSEGDPAESRPSWRGEVNELEWASLGLWRERKRKEAGGGGGHRHWWVNGSNYKDLSFPSFYLLYHSFSIAVIQTREIVLWTIF